MTKKRLNYFRQLILPICPFWAPGQPSGGPFWALAGLLLVHRFEEIQKINRKGHQLTDKAIN